MYCRISDGRIVFELEVRRSFTLLMGDSGKGKTFLCNLVKGGKSSGVSITCEREVKYLRMRGRNDNKWDNTFRDTIAFIDEDDIESLDHDLLKAAYNVNCRVVLCMRDLTFNVGKDRDNYIEKDYAVKSCLVLKGSGKHLIAQEMFQFNKPHKFGKSLRLEDSTSGKAFFEKKGLDLTVSNGKSFVQSDIIDRGIHNTCYLVDGAAFGNHMYFVYPYYLAGKIDLWVPESVEEMYLQSSLFKHEREVQRMLANPEDYGANSTEEGHWETYYEQTLRDVLKDYTNHGYSKGTVPKCFKYKCSECYKHETCDLKQYNINNKFEDVLINCGLQWLLSARDKNASSSGLSALDSAFGHK